MILVAVAEIILVTIWFSEENNKNTLVWITICAILTINHRPQVARLSKMPPTSSSVSLDEFTYPGPSMGVSQDPFPTWPVVSTIWTDVGESVILRPPLAMLSVENSRHHGK
eukprot:scaffold12018_cov192-Amphora_coffeaeformis.AAC.1